MTQPELSDILETHFEVVERLVLILEEHTDHPVVTLYDEGGRGALWELAERLTLEFQEKYKDYTFDGDFMDLIDAFLDEEIAKL